MKQHSTTVIIKEQSKRQKEKTLRLTKSLSMTVNQITQHDKDHLETG